MGSWRAWRDRRRTRRAAHLLRTGTCGDTAEGLTVPGYAPHPLVCDLPPHPGPWHQMDQQDAPPVRWRHR